MKYTLLTCPKDDTWFADGGRCGWAHECKECKECPRAINMHTFKARQGTVFNYNGDMSGGIYIKYKDAESMTLIPASDLLEFVAEHIRSKRIEKIESMTTKEILEICSDAQNAKLK